MYLLVLFRALWLLSVWLVYAVAPDFLLLFFSLALLPFQPKAQPSVSSWLFLDDSNIIQLSIIHLLVLETCKRQVQKRGRALQRPKTARATSSLLRAILNVALLLSLAPPLFSNILPSFLTSQPGSSEGRQEAAALSRGRNPGGYCWGADGGACVLWVFFVAKLVQEVATGVRVVLESHPHITTLDVFAVLRNNPPTYWVWWLLVRHSSGPAACFAAALDCACQVLIHTGKVVGVNSHFLASCLVFPQLAQVLYLLIHTACPLPLLVSLPGVVVGTGAFVWTMAGRSTEGSTAASDRVFDAAYGWSLIIGTCQRIAYGVLLRDKSETWSFSRRVLYLILREKSAVWEIPRKSLELGARLGGGAYGEVYLGKWRGSTVAVKRFKRQSKSECEYERYLTFKEEVNVLSRLRHPRIVEFMGATSRGGELQIVTELLQFGSLYDFLHGPKGMIQRKKVAMDERRAAKIAESIAMGMQFLHTNEPPILHMDLQPGNLLMVDVWSCKLCDFGLSKFKFKSKGDHREAPRGAPQYRAPELIEGHWDLLSEKADVYSFGILLWEIFTCQIPWDGQIIEQVFYSVSDNQERPPLPENASPAYQKLIQDCWAPNPETRPTFTEICARLRELVGSAAAPGSRAGSFTEAMCAQNGVPPAQNGASAAHFAAVGLSPPTSPVHRSGGSFSMGNGSPQLSPVGGDSDSPRRRTSFTVPREDVAGEPSTEEKAGKTREEEGVASTGAGSSGHKAAAPWGVVGGLHHHARAHKSRFSYAGPRIVTPDAAPEAS